MPLWVDLIVSVGEDRAAVRQALRDLQRPDLLARNPLLRNAGGIDKNWDFNPGFGGPLKQDKVWFYASGRSQGAYVFAPGMFFNANENDPSRWDYVPDQSRPASLEKTWLDAQLRLDLAHEIVRADRGAAGRDEHVEAEERALHRPPVLLLGVGHDAELGGHGAGELQRGGHRFATASDTEVLAHLYEEHGDDFVTRLRGMFAIALWDARRHRLLLARDRFGIKPLYYRLADGELSFASELKALLEQPGFSRQIEPRAVAAYLAFNSIPAPLTIFAEARKLPPGCTLAWREGEAVENRFARPAPVPAEQARRGPEGELAEELRSALRDSVSAHLVADVPVGVLLSGGVDSAALTALAATARSEPVRTFSIGFEESSFNELERARLVARRFYGRELGALGLVLNRPSESKVREAVPQLTDFAGPRVHIRPVEGLPLLHVEEPTISGVGWLTKYVMDRAVAAIGLVLLAPLLAAPGNAENNSRQNG